MNALKMKFHAVQGWRYAAIVLGGILLLLGNALPWPCIGSVRDCTALLTYQLKDSWYGLLLVSGVLLIPLEVILLKVPLNYIMWSFFWFLLCLLFVAEIYPVYMETEIWAYLPMLDTNEYLVPSRSVMPLSFIAFWLAVRPRNLQELWKFSSVVALLTLVVLTGAFYVSLELEVREFMLTASLSPDHYVLGTGPIVILSGAILLLAVEVFEMFPDRKK